MAGHFSPRHSYGGGSQGHWPYKAPAPEKPLKGLSFGPRLGFTEMSDSGSRKARASFPSVKMPPTHPDRNAKGPARPPGDCAVLPQGSLEEPADVSSSKGAEPLASPCGAGAVARPPSSWTEGPRGPTRLLTSLASGWAPRELFSRSGLDGWMGGYVDFCFRPYKRFSEFAAFLKRTRKKGRRE